MRGVAQLTFVQHFGIVRVGLRECHPIVTREAGLGALELPGFPRMARCAFSGGRMRAERLPSVRALSSGKLDLRRSHREDMFARRHFHFGVNDPGAGLLRGDHVAIQENIALALRHDGERTRGYDGLRSWPENDNFSRQRGGQS